MMSTALEIDPRAAIRAEPFGALAYHYDTRRLVFLNDPILVRVIGVLASHASVTDALDACHVDPARRSSFVAAIGRLADAGVLRERGR